RPASILTTKSGARPQATCRRSILQTAPASKTRSRRDKKCAGDCPLHPRIRSTRAALARRRNPSAHFSVQRSKRLIRPAPDATRKPRRRATIREHAAGKERAKPEARLQRGREDQPNDIRLGSIPTTSAQCAG